MACVFTDKNGKDVNYICKYVFYNKTRTMHSNSLVTTIQTVSSFPIGCIVAVGPGKVGWCKLNRKDFWKHVSKKNLRVVATERAISWDGKIPDKIRKPNDLLKDIETMTARSKRYFK